MKNLSNTWLTDDMIDFEFKKYTLLAYLQNVKEKFSQHELYPQLSDLLMHYDNLLNLKKNKALLYEQFPQVATGVDLKQLRITYQKLIEDDELMQELSEIIQYALPQINQSITHGRELYDFVEGHLSFDEIGLMPIYQNEGYVLLTEQTDKNVAVYRYKISLINLQKEEYRAIHTQFLFNEIKSITNTFNKIKLKLSKKFSDLPNPATFLVVSKLQFPIKETILPISKRFLLKHVNMS
ncbi:MAG: hypothetical protein ABJF04_02300 [Reichenbachiella sp.]|uniref:hypothetical protein n=1 Tax=Reichenbachiella sp. TaxID=2184521 RepID=UPI003265A7C4